MGGSSSREKVRLESELAQRTREYEELKAKMELVEKKSEIQDLTDMLLPITNQALIGGTLGYMSGFALNVAGRTTAIGVGIGFMLLQGFSYLGYIDVDWRKIERDYMQKLDRDGDGKITADDLDILWRDFKDVLAFNLPAGAGFTGGLLWGAKVATARVAGAAAFAGAGARLLMPRLAIGGASATGLPAIVVAFKKRFETPEDPIVGEYNENTALDN